MILVGFTDQGNLGMGYLASTLSARGWTAEIIDFRQGPVAITDRVQTANPLVVGFSLIFQFFLPAYRDLARHLRKVGVTAHFCMGGHYPSLCHDEVLAAMPELDSVARFEGELTLLDLVENLAQGHDWHGVAGLAFRGADGEIIEGISRPLVEDLDTLPWPVVPGPPEKVLGLAATPILASRGCARRCSFCSIHTFYREAPGKVVRVRAPAKVADEMVHLHEERGARIFLFQDDDFPLWGRVGKRWVVQLADEIDARHLSDRVIWKISCRAEYIAPELFGRLRRSGLYLVYMGLESGTEEGLEVLHKQISVSTNQAAVELLKQLDIMFEYGFMLFDPSTTFASIRQNIAFLRTIVGDGSAGATFCRMLPYGGTPIRDTLRAQGRLRGDVTRPDYEFLDPRLDSYHRRLDGAAAGWIHGNGVSHQLNWAWNEFNIASRLTGRLEGAREYSDALRQLTQKSNEELFRLVEDSASAFEANRFRGFGDTRDSTEQYLVTLLGLRNAFVAENQEALLESAARLEVTGPIVSPQIF